jgi:hypothetical protein
MTKKINVELNPLALAHWLQDICDEIENGAIVCSVEHVQALQTRLDLILDIAAALGIDDWNGPQTMKGKLEQKGLL